MRRALLYLRQSDSDGDGERSLSMDSQATVLREDAARLGWRVVGELRDADLKGYDERRPGLMELYARCRAGEVDLVAFWKLDRFARLLRLQENVVHELDQLGVELYSSQEPWVGNPFFRQILGAVNEEQTRVISANVRRAMRERQRRGLWVGNVPFGYVRPDARSALVIDEARAEVVRWIYEASAAGWSYSAIARELDARGVPATGGRGWSRDSIRDLVRRVAYRGAMVVGDQVVEGTHPAIVDAELWARAQRKAKEDRRAPRQKADKSWLEGRLEHCCGHAMYMVTTYGTRRFRCRAASPSTVRGQHAPCPFAPRMLVAARVEALAWEAVTGALTRLHSPRRVLARAREELRAAAPGALAREREARERLALAVSRRARAEELYLSGSRDRAWFDAEEARALAEIAAAELVLAESPRMPDLAAIEASWEGLRDVRAQLGQVAEGDRGMVLDALGVAVVSPAGVPRYGSDAGRVTIRFWPELRGFFAESLP